MDAMITGAIACASITVGLFFLRFWKSTHDRFFLYFALSFWIQGANRIHIGLKGATNEDDAAIYLIRLAAYLLILIAIWDKNRNPRGRGAR
jgi:hypothetical protein